MNPTPTKTGHTPGPWSTVTNDRHTWILSAPCPLTGGSLKIASTHDTHDGLHDRNTRLIAAAPALLEALRAAAAWEGCILVGSRHNPAAVAAVAKIRAALAQVEG